MSKNELMVAAFEGREADVRSLLTLYAGLADANGQTAMMFAASAGHINCVRLLVEKEQRMQVNTGETALMFAAYNNREDVVAFLLPYEKCMQDIGGQTALMSSVYKRSIGCLKLLMDVEAGIQGKDGATALMIASRLGWKDIVVMLLHKEVTLTDNSGMTALMFAAQTGKWQCGQLLISQEGGMRSVTGRSALMIAAAAGHVEMVKLLISVEAGLQDAQGHTALMYAAYSGRVQTVKTLLAYESGYRDHNYNTALLLSIQHYHTDCAILLIETEEALRNRQDQSPLDLAKALGLTKVVNGIIRFYQQRLKLSGSTTATSHTEHSGLTWNVTRKLSSDCTINSSLKTPTMTPVPATNDIKDSHMLVEELEHTKPSENIINSDLRELIEFYDNSSEIASVSQSRHLSASSDSHTQSAGVSLRNLPNAPKLVNILDSTPSRSSGPGHIVRTKNKNDVYYQSTVNQHELQETISQLSQHMNTISDVLSSQERRIEELADMVGTILTTPRGQIHEKPTKDELWEATRQLVKQNESQVTALGYSLHSVQRNIKGIAGEFEKFKENSRVCLQALEQRCNQMNSVIDEERNINKRSISALRLDVAELKSRTPGRSSKNFSLREVSNSEDEVNAISPHTPDYHIAHGRRRIIPRSQSVTRLCINEYNISHNENDDPYHAQNTANSTPGFISRFKTAIRYLFFGNYEEGSGS